jgi:hypothetical protein
MYNLVHQDRLKRSRQILVLNKITIQLSEINLILDSDMLR